MNLETSIGFVSWGTPPNGYLGFRLREPQIIKVSRNGSPMKVEWNQRGSLEFSKSLQMFTSAMSHIQDNKPPIFLGSLLGLHMHFFP